MSSWDATYRRLRAQYVRNGAGRIERTERALAALENDPTDAAVLVDLHREFHGFAGSGQIYGFAEISAVGRQAEREVAELKARNVAPSPDDIARCRALLEQICRLFSVAAEDLRSKDDAT